MKLTKEYHTAAICFGHHVVSFVHIVDLNSVLTTIGHVFCRRCIRRWAAQQRANKCPNCRSILRKGYCRFKTIKRGLVSIYSE
ncbi:hypothetical protein DL98DRAFT_41625 [Cadophora sp. DSE1049]|nr:hypothetical protein DL98DRAFT_41625 [Cadophora sp. DSE1049]